jgi:hypothetical protein
MRNGARCNANSATATSTGNDDDGGTDESTVQASKRPTGSDHVTMTDDEPSCTNSSGPAQYQYSSLETTDVRRSKNVSSFVDSFRVSSFNVSLGTVPVACHPQHQQHRGPTGHPCPIRLRWSAKRTASVARLIRSL